MHAHFTDEEIVELTICVEAWMFSGRMLQVFGVDAAICRIG